MSATIPWTSPASKAPPTTQNDSGPGTAARTGVSLWHVIPELRARTPGRDPQPLGQPGAALRLFELLS